MESLIKSADFGVCHMLNISRSLRRGLGHVKLEDHIRRLRTWVLHGSDILLRGRTWLLVWGSGKVAVTAVCGSIRQSYLAKSYS